jgi:hypothetical protein
MNLNYKLLLILSLTFSSLTYAQQKKEEKPAATKDTGKSTIALTAPEKMELKAFVYEPVDPYFWEKIDQNLKDNNFTETVYLGAQTMMAFDPSTPEYSEGKLAVAIGLFNLKITYGATVMLMDLAKTRIGTQIGNYALNYLDEITQTTVYDSKELTTDFLNSYEFANMPPKIQSFVSFHQSILNSAYGFKRWADPEFAKIHKESYWYYMWMYLSALKHIQNQKVEQASAIFDAINADEKAPPKIKEKSKLQTARLLFEKGNFEEALKVYRELNLPLREMGRLLLERSWAMYYLKDYSHALGVIRALESPYFASSMNPESYVLEMVIYKQLCHYEAVEESVGRFYERFTPTLDLIRHRKPLQKDYILGSMALMEYDIQDLANFVDMIRKEREELDTYSWDSFPFFKELMSKYKAKDKEVRMRLDSDIERKTKSIAEDLLDIKEQVDYIDYTSKLDALRIVRRGENRLYRSEKINYLLFDRIFWPFKGDYWLDELPDYRVLIQSQCDVETPSSVTTPGGGDKGNSKKDKGGAF